MKEPTNVQTLQVANTAVCYQPPVVVTCRIIFLEKSSYVHIGIHSRPLDSSEDCGKANFRQLLRIRTS